MRLYAYRWACSLVPHIALHELGIAHELVWVDILGAECEEPEHLARNPIGMVPVLELEDGSHLTEVSAILLYLAERHPEAGWIPAERHRLYERLSFVATELHKCFYPLFYGKQIHKDAVAVEELAEAFRARVRVRLGRVAEWLGTNDYMLGSFGPVDIYLYAVLMWWTRGLKLSLDEWPRLVALKKRIEARPAVQAALEHEKA